MFNSNTVNSKFHLIRSYCEIIFYNFPNIPCLKYTVNSNFHLIRSKNLADDWLWINRSRPVAKKLTWIAPVPPWFLGIGSSFWYVLAMCAYHIKHPYALSVKIYSISITFDKQKIMLLCGFYWHSRYSIWICTFIVIKFVWLAAVLCGV